MEAIIPTGLIISIGILAGCSSPSATIMAAGTKASSLPLVGAKVHVVEQSPQQPVDSLKSHQSASNYWPDGPGIQTLKGQQILSDTVAAQLADKGYIVVPSREADYWVTAHLSRVIHDSAMDPKAVRENRDIVRSYDAGTVEVSGPEGEKTVPVKIPYVTNEYLDRPDTNIDPDDDFVLSIEIRKVSRNRSDQPKIVWTAKLVTKDQADPQYYVRTLLNYLGQDVRGKIPLALK